MPIKTTAPTSIVARIPRRPPARSLPSGSCAMEMAPSVAWGGFGVCVESARTLSGEDATFGRTVDAGGSLTLAITAVAPRPSVAEANAEDEIDETSPLVALAATTGGAGATPTRVG